MASLAHWLSQYSNTLVAWAGAVCIFGIYTVLYKENKCYRFFEHIFIGLYGGYAVYVTWAEILKPKWWDPMSKEGQWYLVLYAVVGSMFYFIYSKKHAWISRVIFGLFMGFSAGGIFREYYETYFPQIASSMKPVTGSFANILSVVVFYAIFLAAMTYFFFSFEHKHPAVKTSAAAGRWFLMIGFGAMFGSTVMGRMTLFIGRLNFLITKWWPKIHDKPHPTITWISQSSHFMGFWIAIAALVLLAAALVYMRMQPGKKNLGSE